MKAGGVLRIVALWAMAISALSPSFSPPPALAGASIAQVDNPNPPTTPVKLVFVHHSCGGNWLADPNDDQPYGGLGIALRDNNYFVSATNYGWGPEGIGDRTDIPSWTEWFTGPSSGTILNALYKESSQNMGDFGHWSRLQTDPGGDNEIILFKSCFPNSDLYGNPDDPPLSEPNDQFTVSNAKAVYIKLLTYFETRPDKLFVVVTAPPMAKGEYSSDAQPGSERAANARAFNNWLVNEWLVEYPYHNVAVFDYYNVLTSNGSANRIDDPGTNQEPNDAGREDGNHHRWWNGAIQHIQTIDNNYSAYPIDSEWDSHPATTGQQKATVEFVPLLNVYYDRWKSSPAPKPTLAATPTRFSEPTPTPAQDTQPTSTLPTSLAEGIIDDFESVAGEWETHVEAGSTGICEPDRGMAHGGAASLRIGYDVKLHGWMDCGQHFEPLQDWGSSTGLSVWLLSDPEGEKVTLTLFSGDPQAATPFEVHLRGKEAWTRVVIPWADFERAAWAGEGGPSHVNPAQMVGYGFHIEADQATRKGTIWVDDIGLVTSEIEPPAEEATPTSPTKPIEETEPAATKESTATPKPPTTAAPIATVEPTTPADEKTGRGPCASAIALPLAAVALVLARRGGTIGNDR